MITRHVNERASWDVEEDANNFKYIEPRFK